MSRDSWHYNTDSIAFVPTEIGGQQISLIAHFLGLFQNQLFGRLLDQLTIVQGPGYRRTVNIQSLGNFMYRCFFQLFLIFGQAWGRSIINGKSVVCQIGQSLICCPIEYILIMVPIT